MNFFNNLTGNENTNDETPENPEVVDKSKENKNPENTSLALDEIKNGQGDLTKAVKGLGEQLNKPKETSPEEAQTELKSKIVKMLNLQNPTGEDGLLFPKEQFKYLENALSDVFQQALQYSHNSNSGKITEKQVKQLIADNRSEADYTANVTNTLSGLATKLGIDENYLRFLATEKVKENPNLTLEALITDLGKQDFSGIPKKSPKTATPNQQSNLAQDFLGL